LELIFNYYGQEYMILLLKAFYLAIARFINLLNNMSHIEIIDFNY